MTNLNVCIFFALFMGTLAKHADIANDVLDLEWYRSGIYFTHKGLINDKSTNGIIPMYQKISNYSAFYAIFQYNRNKFAAEQAVEMFKTSLASANPDKMDSKSFLEEVLKRIDNRLLQDDITGEQAKSETMALIVILGPTTLTLAEVGDMGKALFTTKINFFKESLCHVTLQNSRFLNVLGGKAAKAKNPNIRGDAQVNRFTSMKWIVLGTKRLRALSENQIKQKVTKHANDLKKAAQKVTELMHVPRDETDSGVIVIDGQPMTSGDKNLFLINLGCFRVSDSEC